LGPDVCTNPECTHEDPNVVLLCPSCGCSSLITRPLALPGSIVAYDPLCGITLMISEQKAPSDEVN